MWNCLTGLEPYATLSTSHPPAPGYEVAEMDSLVCEPIIAYRADVLDPSGVRGGPRDLLYILAKRPRISQGRLAALVCVSRMTISRWLKEFKDQGLIRWKRTGKSSVYEVVMSQSVTSDVTKRPMDHMHTLAQDISSGREAVMRHPESEEFAGTEDAPRTSPRGRSRRSVTGSNPALDAYLQRWDLKHRGPVPCPSRGSRFMRDANEILTLCGDDETVYSTALDAYFSDSDKYTAKEKHPLWLLKRNLHKYLGGTPERTGFKRNEVV